jgi:hypothetical protein
MVAWAYSQLVSCYSSHGGETPRSAMLIKPANQPQVVECLKQVGYVFVSCCGFATFEGNFAGTPTYDKVSCSAHPTMAHIRHSAQLIHNIMVIPQCQKIVDWYIPQPKLRW